MFSSIHWPIAATLSGMIESFFLLLAIVYWYSYSVTHWANETAYSAINAGAKIPPNTEGFAALALMFLHPVTWRKFNPTSIRSMSYYWWIWILPLVMNPPLL